jgi:trk system potassium uptake protein TrkH
MSTSWVGGVGVVMFALVILPSIGRSKRMLSSVELSSLAKDNFNYRTQTIVRIVLITYVLLTAVTTVALKLAGMCWFDALCHAMSACGTCGFGTKNTSIAFFNSAAVELILVLAMCLAGLHFGLIYATITGKSNNIFRSEVSRVYFTIIGVSSVLIAISLWLSDIYPTLWLSLRSGLFHTVSFLTTSGFATVDCNTWSSFAILILIFCSIVCGCAGSTSGGLKVDRFLVAAKMIRTRVRAQRHPDAIFRTKIDGIVQGEDMMGAVMVFIVAYMMLILIGTFLNTLFGADLMTGFSAAVSCTSNVGPGFGEVGTMSNYSLMPIVTKLNLTVLMLLGRLEIFGLIQLFFIRWWR